MKFSALTFPSAFVTILVLALFSFMPLKAGMAGEFQPGQERHVKVRILPEHGIIHPGEEIWVGVEQSIAPEWHTYWRNPGDSGVEPRIKWDLPAGFTIGEIHWPIPSKLPYGPMTNYGYANNVILLQKLKAPANLPPGPIPLSATVDVLVCHDICIPESGKYSVILNSDSSDTAEDNAAYLDEAAAKLPALAPDHAILRKTDEKTIEVEFPSADWCNSGPKPCSDLELFPLEWGIVTNTARAETSFDGKTLTLRQQGSDRDWSELSAPHLLVTYTNAQGQRAGMEFIADIEGASPVTGENNASASQSTQSLPLILAFALLGGLILNLMPCVFPVLSLKALSLVKIAQKSQTQARLHGIAYAAGIILSFLLIAGLLIGLKGAGLAVGWGFHLQNPAIITILLYVLFIIGLNLMGFFEVSLGGALGNVGNKLTQGSGFIASFFTGVLATLVATPCTAPFMGAAIGFALTHSTLTALLVFTFLGLGLALPYLALSFIPGLQRCLPKPGAWMEIFRQFLAFPVFLTCAWLIWVLSQQVGSTGILGAALGLTSLSFAIWLWREAPAKGFKRKFVIALAILSGLAAIGFLPATRAAPEPGAQTSALMLGETYSPSALDQALATGQPVFVEMTAAWCITCKVNHATSIDIESTHKLFQEKNIKFLVGDWTNYDPVITEYLSRFGRNGVPLYVYYAPAPQGGSRPAPVVLPQILTPGLVAETIAS